MKLWQKLPLFIKILIPSVLVIAAVATLKPKPKPNFGGDSEAVLPSVQVVPAERQIARLSVRTQGSVDSLTTIDLVSQVGGQIVAVSKHFYDGACCGKGDVLLEIEGTD